MTEYLELDDLLTVADAVGPETVVRDVGLLEAALARARASAFGEDAYPSLDGKAAALLSSLVRNHALVDGNKRLGWVTTRLFYAMNDLDLRAPHDEAHDLVISIASGSVTDIDTIAAVLARWAVEP